MRPLLVAGFLVLASVARAQECTGMWTYLLDTDPDHPKVISGDTNAAYAVFSFWGDPGKRYQLKGEFPHARFLSVETNATRWGKKLEAIFDYQLVPDPGSQNPFLPGVPVDVSRRSFTIDIVSEGTTSAGPNSVHLPVSREQESVLVRIYSPEDGVTITPASVPRVFAYDVASGEPASCPDAAGFSETLSLPEALTWIVHRKPQFGFLDVKIPWGPNSAIPYYLGGVTRTRDDDVAIVRFKAPSYADTQSGTGSFPGSAEVRYWSFCTEDLVKLETFNCLPDHLARPDAQGMVTVVYGSGEELRRVAESRGYDFLEDRRAPDQPVAEFAYRNILPSADFSSRSMYRNDYRPQGVLCARDRFLSGQCE